jgi:predicted porin
MFNLGEIHMKKTLVALAALAATGAFAQSSITLYGIGDLWFGSDKAVTTTAGVAAGVGQTVLNSGGLSGSRFGLRGAEDLGGGLKANFQFENQFQLDSGDLGAQNDFTGKVATAAGTTLGRASAQTLFGRQAFVGLSGGFGEVTLGNQYPSYDEVRGGFDPQGHSAFSATAGGAWAAGKDYTFRVSNSLKYTSANFGGLQLGLTYGMGENKTVAASAANLVSAKITYGNGPIAVGFAYQQEKHGVASGALAVGTAPTNNLAGQGTGILGTTEKHTLITGSYDFGVAKLGLGYNTSKDNGATASGADKEFQVGVTVPVGAATIIADFASSKAAATAASLTGHKATAFGAQALYALSKRTNLYVAGRQIKNDTTQFVANPATLASTKSTRFGLGVRHTF